jgi:hypothetical protein
MKEEEEEEEEEEDTEAPLWEVGTEGGSSVAL